MDSVRRDELVFKIAFQRQLDARDAAACKAAVLLGHLLDRGQVPEYLREAAHETVERYMAASKAMDGTRPVDQSTEGGRNGAERAHRIASEGYDVCQGGAQ